MSPKGMPYMSHAKRIKDALTETLIVAVCAPAEVGRNAELAAELGALEDQSTARAVRFSTADGRLFRVTVSVDEVPA